MTYINISRISSFRLSINIELTIVDSEKFSALSVILILKLFVLATACIIIWPAHVPSVDNYSVNIATIIDQSYILRNVLGSLLNVELQELLFGNDDLQFRKVGGLHCERAITITDNVYWLSSYAS